MALSDYNGEEIVDSITIRKGQKYYDKKWMPRTVFNDPQGKNAYIIGNGESRLGFNLSTLPKDTYGCNALYRDYTPDYLIVIDLPIYQEVIASGYNVQNIVYTNRSNMKRVQGNSHLIPYNPYYGAGTTAMHIAINDGHTNLICIGFDCGVDGPNNNVYKDTNAYRSKEEIVNQNVWGEQIYKMMLSYPNVTWTFVEGTLPKKFTELTNCKIISYTSLKDIING